jgi:hypothetical protein
MPVGDTVTVLPSLDWGATERRGRNATSHARTEGPSFSEAAQERSAMCYTTSTSQTTSDTRPVCTHLVSTDCSVNLLVRSLVLRVKYTIHRN